MHLFVVVVCEYKYSSSSSSSSGSSSSSSSIPMKILNRLLCSFISSLSFLFLSFPDGCARTDYTSFVCSLNP